jgi:cell shape-determining protein MreD
MKDFLLFLALGIVIFITESIVLAMPRFQWFRYDLFIPLIIFTGLYQSIHVGLPLCILFGFFMDVFSGGIFGLFLSIYFWLFCFVKAVLRFLDLQNLFLEAVLVVLGVLAENLTIILLMQLLGQGQQIRYVTVQGVIIQTLVAGATAPLMFMVFFRLRDMRLPRLFYLR